MPRDQIEKEPQSRAVKVGEWFNPFSDYNRVPYDFRREDYQSKELRFYMEPIGRIGINLEREVAARDVNLNGLVVQPWGETTVKSAADVKRMEEKLESRLLELLIGAEDKKHIGKNIPFQIEIELPSRRFFVNQFVFVLEDAQPLVPSFRWKEKGSDEELTIFFPEVENVLKSLRMRIIPLKENTNAK